MSFLRTKSQQVGAGPRPLHKVCASGLWYFIKIYLHQCVEGINRHESFLSFGFLTVSNESTEAEAFCVPEHGVQKVRKPQTPENHFLHLGCLCLGDSWARSVSRTREVFKMAPPDEQVRVSTHSVQVFFPDFPVGNQLF